MVDGAFMSVNPDIKTADNLECFDFISLNPNMEIGLCLRTPVVDGWTSKGTMFEKFVHGSYSRESTDYESSVVDKINRRMRIKKEMKSMDKSLPEYKEKWYEQNGIKINLNATYGAGGSGCFKNMYNKISAGDTTGSAKACILNAKETFEKHGYTVAYIHTDGIKVIDHLHDKNRLIEIASEISEFQRCQMNIYNPLHELLHEDSLSKIWLIQNDRGINLKNRNICLYKNGKVDYTGLKIVSLATSKLAKQVFKQHIQPQIEARTERIQYPCTQVLEWCKSSAEELTTLLERRYRVGSLTSYKTTSSIQAQISFRYGAGDHKLIVNKFIGAGKSKKYATLEELQKAFGDKWLNAVDFRSYVADLSEFIHPDDRKNIKKL